MYFEKYFNKEKKEKKKKSGAAVRRPHGKHQDMGLNPAAARNLKKTDIRQTPAQKVPQ